MRQGIPEPQSYADLVSKMKKIVGSNIFSTHFIKIITYYKKIGYYINALQQTACLVVSPVRVSIFALPLELHDSGSHLRFYDGSDLMTYL